MQRRELWQKEARIQIIRDHVGVTIPVYVPDRLGLASPSLGKPNPHRCIAVNCYDTYRLNLRWFIAWKTSSTEK